jgi:outer membrane protein TolC
MKRILVVLLMIISLDSFCQKYFSKDDLIAVVKKFHPVARQAMIDVKIADANMTAQKGLFDPVLNLSNSSKEYENINYYNQESTALKIPAWYGIDVVAGRERLTGDRLNPEETKGAFNYIGVDVPLIENFIIDKRKAVINQARLIKNETEAGLKIILNDLLYEAIISYWQWWEQHEILQVVQSSLITAEKRFSMVKNAGSIGERPAIDTIEAQSQLQSLQQKESEVLMNIAKSRIQLSLYLWSENGTAYDLPEDAIPQAMEKDIIRLDSLEASVQSHPEIAWYDIKLKYLQIERKLKLQALLPGVDLRYRHLQNDAYPLFNNTNNYRLSVGLSIPLRLSEARGNFSAAKLKISQALIGRDNKMLQLQNKVNQYYAEWVQVIKQLAIQKGLVSNFSVLLKGEETLFFNGESSMFMVNARELKKLEALEKQVMLQAKIQRSAAALKWSSGLLYL